MTIYNSQDQINLSRTEKNKGMFNKKLKKLIDTALWSMYEFNARKKQQPL